MTGERPQHAVPGNGSTRATLPRICVAFSFYRLRHEALALPVADRRRIAEEFVNTVDAAADHLGILRAYSLVGTRGDADFLLWQAAEEPEGLQRFAAALRTAELFALLDRPYHYLAMTRRSMYVDEARRPGADSRGVTVKPTGSRYLFVYPFVKTRAWYALPIAERQRMMDEHIRIGKKYPEIKINTTYSYGLDDQEFVVAFEGDSPSEFLDLLIELRSSEASSYTLRDTPSFTAVAQPLGPALELALGIAQPLPTEAEAEATVSRA
ncbi:MAG: chlorite dismutase family protein [Chloroflexota bacterium]|nr:chlorite dismutase family protein [Chloroflexota bacterium]